MASPGLDQHLCLAERCEDLAVEQLIPELGVETLTVAVLPGASGFDVERLDADPAKPFADAFRDELRPIV